MTGGGGDASVRGRLGWLFTPNVLLYATGGVSWLNLSSTSTCALGTVAAPTDLCTPGASVFGGFAPSAITHRTTLVGGTVGGGLEAMLAPNWIARGEYRYSSYGTIGFADTRTATVAFPTLVVVGTPSVVSYKERVQTHTATFGISYLFGGTPTSTTIAPGMPVKAPLLKAPPLVYSWSGFYLGAGAGARAATIDNRVTNETLNGVAAGPFVPANCAFPTGCVFGEPLDQVAPRGVVYGGYNWQVAPRWLVGIEGDVGFASRTRTLAGMDYPVTDFFGIGITGNGGDTFAVQTRWDASVRGRLGWLFTPDVLLYATGGVSWLNLSSTSTCVIGGAACTPGAPAISAGFTPSVITDRATPIGVTVGGGLEAMLAPNWIARGEYRYSSYGTVGFADTRTATAAAPFIGVVVGTPSIVSRTERVQTHTATFGISYLFGGGPISTRY